MKNITINILLGILALILINCKKSDAPGLSAQQQAAQKLSVTWGNAEVLASPSGNFGTLEGLTLTFEANGQLEPTGFAAAGAPDYFLSGSTSTWSWGNATSTAKVNLVNVSPVQELSIESLTDTNLSISFTYEGPIEGKIKGIGEYRIRFVRVP